jgi:hypothetical protein
VIGDVEERLRVSPHAERDGLDSDFISLAPVFGEWDAICIVTFSEYEEETVEF